MKTAAVRRILKSETKSFLFSHYPESIFLSGIFLLLCMGASALYTLLYETACMLLPADAHGIIRELLLFCLSFFLAPIFGAVLSRFGLLIREKEKSPFRFERERMRGERIAGAFLYGLFSAVRFCSFALSLWESAVPDETENSLFGSFLSVLFGIASFLFYVLLLFLILCVVCVFLSGKLSEQSFFAALFGTVQKLMPVTGLLFRSIFSFAFLGILSYVTYGFFLFFFALPYVLFYLCHLSRYADCRRFVSPLRNGVFSRAPSAVSTQFE